ncbi:GntR family transcriptional regulator [Jiella pacifica]|uniref:GntR family transcriptional regulator n=1 Tax=Jiella pacifica TaxID=2696469 RepID=A0A6N9T7H9_9HYPH|nr:GntR family transcriptional regulator [Jiella pacifica]NDW07364.1 GntR family transcriptional regulator [Jiella pacifica]
MSFRPIYAELADELICGIQNGTFPVGALLPTEVEIARERQLSRSTVRAALNRLVTLGLVTRQKGVGTRVASSVGHSSYDASTTSIEELVHFGAATDRLILSREEIVSDDRLAARLGFRPGTRWILVKALPSDFLSNDPPICWTDNYIEPRYADALDGLEGYRGLIADRIAERHGVVVDEVVQVIRPTVLSDVVADMLDAVPGSPALDIIRRYSSAGTIVYVSASQHPADRFEYRMSLRRR